MRKGEITPDCLRKLGIIVLFFPIVLARGIYLDRKRRQAS